MFARITSVKALSRCLRAAMGDSDKNHRREKTTEEIRDYSDCNTRLNARDVPIEDNFSVQSKTGS